MGPCLCIPNVTFQYEFSNFSVNNFSAFCGTKVLVNVHPLLTNCFVARRCHKFVSGLRLFTSLQKS